MALSLTTRLAALTGLGILLAGCCANNVCDCPNEAQADAIRIEFDSSFKRPDELDTLLLVRYLRTDSLKPPVPLPKPETVTIVRTAAQLAANDTLLINNATPFGQLGSARLDTFRYVLHYYPGTKPRVRPSKRLVYIRRVELSGSLDGNGCCTCYTNSRKLVEVWPDSNRTKAYSTDLRLRKAGLVVTK